MKKKSSNVLSERLKQQETERKKVAERVLANIKEMNEKQKAWVRQRFRHHEREK
jgi:hypothetical protein